MEVLLPVPETERPKRLNVVLVAPGFPPLPVGGGATHAFYLVHALGALRGVRVHVIAQEPESTKHPFTGRVRIHRVKAGQDLGKPPFGQFLEKALRVVARIRSREGFAEHESLVVHGQHWGGIFVAMNLKHVFRVPAVATIHKTPIGLALGNTVTSIDPSYCHFKWLATWPIDVFIAGSSFFERELRNQVSSGRVERILHGVSDPWLRGESTASKRRQLREKLGLTEDARLVLCPVRWDPRKRVSDFIDAAGKLVAEMPTEDIRFLVSAGTDKRGQRDLMKRARTAGIADRILVQLLDFEDMPAAFRTASLVVYPTDREGLGLSALEAMALERPVIATDAEGIREVISNERDGYLYAAGETDHLAHIMAKLLRDRPHAAEIGQRARETVIQMFSHTSMAARHLEVYRSLTT